MLKALLTIGSLQLLAMLVHLVRTKSLAVILGPEWIGVMAVVDRLLGIIAQIASLSLRLPQSASFRRCTRAHQRSSPT